MWWEICRLETQDLAGATRQPVEAPGAFRQRSPPGSRSRFYRQSVGGAQSKRNRIAERSSARNRPVSASAEDKRESKKEERTGGRGYTETATWMKCGMRTAEQGANLARRPISAAHSAIGISSSPLARMRTSVPPYRFARTTDQIRGSTAVEPVARSRINNPSLVSAAGAKGDDRSSEAGSGSLGLLE